MMGKALNQLNQLRRLTEKVVCKEGDEVVVSSSSGGSSGGSGGGGGYSAGSFY